MSAVQLAPGIWRVPTTPFDLINSFLLEAPDGSMTVVDAGLKRASGRVLAALAGLGKARQDVTHLVLSHAHLDHAGGAAAVQVATGGEVWAHDREAVYLREGRSPTQDRAQRGGRLFARMPGGFAKLDVAATFADGAVLPVGGGLTVVHTPGHTPGHCSFLHEPTGVLLTGDALFNLRSITFSFAGSCTDVSLSRASAAWLGELDFEVAAFAHGPQISREAPRAVRAFLAGRRA